MPGKKKKSGNKSGARPIPTHQDSLRRDIEAGRNHNIDPTSHEFGAEEDEDGLDIADQLLASLDARDKAAEKVQKASLDEERANESHHFLGSHHSKSEQSGLSTSGHPSSPLRHAGEKLLHAGEKIFGHHGNDHHSGSLSSSPGNHHHPEKVATVIPTDDVDRELASDMQRKGSIRKFFGQSPPTSTKSLSTNTSAEIEAEQSGSGGGKKKMSRQKARLERKAAEMEAQRLQAEEELKANGGKPDEAQRERVALTDLCRALKVQMHEITPDGHCLYAAVADQLNILGKSHSNLNYIDTRKATAEYMRTHADDFMPFISDSDEHMAGIENKEAGKMTHNMSQQEKYFLGYCDAIEKTAVWGGQPEILALSRAYHTPIHVVQAGSPVVKVGTEEASDPEEVPVIISYHRHMYGLGEHYNSLHKVKAG